MQGQIKLIRWQWTNLDEIYSMEVSVSRTEARWQEGLRSRERDCEPVAAKERRILPSEGHKKVAMIPC